MNDDPKPPKPEPETEGGDKDVSTDVSPPAAQPGGMIGEGEPQHGGERRGGMGGEG
jgi:hypothetical protein